MSLEGDEGMKNAALKALQDVKKKERKDKSNEKKMLKRMFKPNP